MRPPAPMLATPGPAPADGDTRYAYEWTYDGIRCLAWISDGVCHMTSRNGNSLNAAFPEISHALARLPRGTAAPLVTGGDTHTPRPVTGTRARARPGRTRAGTHPTG
ncbi:hypothetical protein [Nocardia sp. NPDC004123]